VVSAADLYDRNLDFLDQSRYLFLLSSSSIVLTRLSGPTLLLRKSGRARKRTQDLWIYS
jgi:hypothetical protein